VPDRLQLQSAARQRLSTPTPRVFYINDDLTDDVRARYGPGSEACRLADALMNRVRREAPRVIVLTEDEQMEALVARGAHAPFTVTVGIGHAGERVARRLHARTGWFPVVERVEVARAETGRGDYTLVTGTATLAEQLAPVEGAPMLAVVDDTVFSGQTMRAILGALSPDTRARTHAFCLRAVAETLETVAALCPITAGIAAPGRILEDVSFINASGLVRRGAIRHTTRPPLAFFEREEWMRAWFPGYADEVTQLCRRLNALLEPT